ncbi:MULTISPECIES: hypothetical protein [unclassified Streptomyces]|uniref:hypothetical protein n=1 Tax=unclassified Streptomyces TaxID=2593676 RepID=UPI002966D13E|nr:hypothetical protein [Streptomyces sp. SJL17-1]
MTMEPLTEQRNVTGPIVFGFLRLVGVSASRQQALAKTITDYCRRHELTLGGVYMERCAATSGAFTGMLDAVAATRPYGIVFPAPSHLGPRAIAAHRRQRLHEAGTEILLVRGARPPVADESASTPNSGSTTS